ncbi:hypothetical protein HUB98_06275 [Paenibacillus barcinonensis]|uniref:Uncharacterized protein n=1 Tax=Paenibacillus barcinonensis TaxID=198119 RepID=A0A2V4W8H7_PAEBA|nr:hypothetical protein [Paenibacillus barcinonensis]PYE51623.1 hypothetical protein DFQ00_102418 [Paenibacillus barcinonensis]QKS55987.1 hypothetical protein HUB98_06275 [Paenibacillus barcinonensis]
MRKGKQGNHSTITWEDRYYDGYGDDWDYYDERMVSEYMKQGIDDCIEYIEVAVDQEVLWLKNNTHR